MADLPSSVRPPLAARSRFRDLAWPREHGSWSLVLEPLALGLFAAPSLAGGVFAIAVLAAFFARRPLKIAARDPLPVRRRAARRLLVALAGLALLAFAAACAITAATPGWLAWLAPAAIAGAVFLRFDLADSGRDAPAEIAGAAAFAALPAALAALAVWPAPAAAALAFAMLARAVPTVMLVRACVRGTKTGDFRAAPALAAAVVAALAALPLVFTRLASAALAVALALLLVRASALLVSPRPALPPRMLGLIEFVLGIAYVATLATAWPR